MMKALKVLAVLAGGLFASASANAVVLAPSPGPLETGTSYAVTFNSAGGGSNLSFDLLGYLSLDGVNGYTDTFHLSLNGTELFSGSYNLGGGGANATYLNLIGATIAGLNGDPTYYASVGGSITITGLINLLAGSNTLTFAYDPGQGLGDEAWGVNNINVSSVPLPGAALLLGSGLLGLAGLRRKVKKV